MKGLTYREIINGTKSQRNPFVDVQKRKGVPSANLKPNVSGISIGTQTLETNHKNCSINQDIFSKYLQYFCELCEFKTKIIADFEIHMNENHNEYFQSEKTDSKLLDNSKLPEKLPQNWPNK